MQALDVVKETINKNITEKIVVLIRRGPKGYPLYLRLRILLYAVLMEIFETRKLVKHSKKRPSVIKRLGFKKMPSKRTLDRWKLKHEYELEQLIEIVGDSYLQLSESEWTLLDSTPIVDEEDPDATTGYNSQGLFIGFKLHMSCDEYEVPLRATFTQAHVHDSQKGSILLAPTPKAGGDCAYDVKELKLEAKEKGTKLITSHNPRREGRKAKKPTPKILKKVRVCIEQCNGFIKSQVMKHLWMSVKGLKAKATFCLTAVLAIQALAIYNLKRFGYPSIRIAELRV
jgi:hypothetical protein